MATASPTPIPTAAPNVQTTVDNPNTGNIQVVSFSSTVVLAGVSLGPSGSLAPEDQQALEMATAATLQVPSAAVTYKGLLSPTTSSTRAIGTASIPGSNKVVEISRTDVERHLSAEMLTALLSTRVTVGADQIPNSLYAKLTASLSLATTSGAFTAALMSAAKEVKSTAMLAATVTNATSSSLSIETVVVPVESPANNSAKTSHGVPLRFRLVAGGAGALLLMAALLLCWHRHRRKRTETAIAKYIDQLDLRGEHMAPFGVSADSFAPNLQRSDSRDSKV